MTYRRLAGALVAFAVAVPAAATTPLDYSLVTLGNYTDAGGSNIGTGIAVAGNARINSTAIGTRLGAASDNTGVVIVGGNIAYDNSTLAHGSVVFGATNTSGQYTQARTPRGSFTAGSTLDFASIATGLTTLSSQYGALATTGSFTSLYNAGTLSGARTSGTDVFTLTTAQLGGVYALRMIGTAGSKAIVNIVGTSFGSHFSFDRGNYAVADITFNFLDATAISFGGIDLGASVLAPLARFTQNGGFIRGSVAVGEFYAAGGNIVGDGQFSIADVEAGGAAGAVPEPATWAMLLAGFGLVGATMRRRNPMPGVAA